MSDQRGYFEHYRQNSVPVVRKLTDAPVHKRIHPAAPPKYKGEGLCLGADVQVLPDAAFYDVGHRSYYQGGFPAQVWAKAPASYGRGKWWWVATGEAFYKVEEGDLLLLGHCHDEPLFEAS